MTTSEQIAAIRKTQQDALDQLDNFEACQNLNPGAHAVWLLARKRMADALACLADVETIQQM